MVLLKIRDYTLSENRKTPYLSTVKLTIYLLSPSEN